MALSTAAKLAIVVGITILCAAAITAIAVIARRSGEDVTVYRNVKWFCKGHDKSIEGIKSAESCWEACQKQIGTTVEGTRINDIVAIDYWPSSKDCFCQNSCDEKDLDDGERGTVIVKSNINIDNLPYHGED